jgi:tetratricopeptide (TPR) repeat protein
MRSRKAGRAGAAAPPPAAHARGDRLSVFLPSLLVAAAAIAAYAGALANGFTFDDHEVIVGAQYLLSHLGHVDDLFSRDYFYLSHEATYRPVVTLSYILDHQIGGLAPAVYHAQSLAWHVGCALLVLALARRLLPAAPKGLLLGAALLFALHPVATEAIDNASFREDPLATFFTLATVLLALQGTLDALIAALACYAIALFAKESAIVAPALLLAARQVVPRASPSRSHRVRELALFAAVTAGYLVVRFVLLPGSSRYGEPAGGTLGGTLAYMPRVLLRYLRLLVAPAPLCADYRGVLDFVAHPSSPLFLLSYLLFAALAAGAILALRARHPLGLGLAWFLVALLPVSNVIPLPVPVAERFLYLPLVGFALAAAAALAHFHHRVPMSLRRPLACAGVAALLACTIFTHLRHRAWRDNETLWATTARAFPASWSAHHGLGAELLGRHELDRASVELHAALRLAPESRLWMIENDVSVLYDEQGKHDEALAILRSSVSRQPHPATLFNLALTLLERKDLAGASDTLERAIRIDPYYGPAYGLLASVRVRQRRLGDAADLLAHGQALSPHDASVENAIEDLRKAGGR